MYEFSCDVKNIFLEKLNLTRGGKCLPNANYKKRLSDMTGVKYTRQLLDRSCNSKYSRAANLQQECSSALCPVVRLKDISILNCLSQNDTVQLACLSSCLPDELFMTPSCASEMSSTIFQTVHCECNVLQEKKWLQSRILSESDIFSAEVCDCDTKENRVEIKPSKTDYTVIAFDLTSELGKRKLVNGYHRYNQYKGSRMPLVTSSYERFCNQSSELGNVSSRLRAGSGNFPVVYQRNRKIPDCDVHRYRFTKRQRCEFCKRVDLQLKYKVMPCVVLVPVLSELKLLMLSQKKLGMCRVRLRRLSQRTLSAWRVKKKVIPSRAARRRTKEIKRDVNKQYNNCFVCLNQLPPHMITKSTSTRMFRASRSRHSVSKNVIKSCSVSLCALPRHVIH